MSTVIEKNIIKMSKKRAEYLLTEPGGGTRQWLMAVSSEGLQMRRARGGLDSRPSSFPLTSAGLSHFTLYVPTLLISKLQVTKAAFPIGNVSERIKCFTKLKGHHFYSLNLENK